MSNSCNNKSLCGVIRVWADRGKAALKREILCLSHVWPQLQQIGEEAPQTSLCLCLARYVCTKDRTVSQPAKCTFIHDAALRDVVMGTMVIITTMVIPIDRAIIMNKAFT